MRSAAITLIFWILIAGAVGAVPDQPAQTPANEWILWDSGGNRLGYTNTVCGFADGGDSTATANRVTVTYSTACACWNPASTMQDGSPIRDTYLNVYKTSGPDTLLLRVKLHGFYAAPASVDSTAMADNANDSRTTRDGSLTGGDVQDYSLGADDLADVSVPHRVLGAEAVDGSNLSSTLTKTDCRMRIRSILSDSSAVGDASHAGYAWFYDGFGHRVEALCSASMAADVAWYWPVATGSTNGIYQKTATGAQITLSVSGLTGLDATTVTATLGAFTRFNASGVSGADTSGVKNQLRVGKKFIVGGWGNIGKTYFQRDGLQWSFGPAGLSGSGATEVVYGNAATGDVLTYSVAGATETITPTSPDDLMDSMPTWYGTVTLPASTQYVGFRAPGATANTVVNANFQDSVTGTNITYLTVSASTDTLWATASSTKLVDRVVHISGTGK